MLKDKGKGRKKRGQRKRRGREGTAGEAQTEDGRGEEGGVTAILAMQAASSEATLACRADVGRESLYLLPARFLISH